MTGELDSTSEKPFTLKDLDEWITRLGRKSPTVNDMMRFTMLSMKVEAIFKVLSSWGRSRCCAAPALSVCIAALSSHYVL